MKMIMNEDRFFMWNEDNELIVKYSKSEGINKLIFRNVIKIPRGF